VSERGYGSLRHSAATIGDKGSECINSRGSPHEPKLLAERDDFSSGARPLERVD
jgi:hypothetical protein